MPVRTVDEPPAAVRRLRDDPVLGDAVAEHGPLEIVPADDTFRRLVVSVVRQQVSMAAAAAIRERLFERVEVTPAGVAAADRAELTAAGLSEQKARYVEAIADAYRERGYDRSYFADMDDEAVVGELTTITGVGDWTAKMFLVFCLGRPDVFPVEDLGIRNGMDALFGRDLSRAEMVDRAERWRPHRSYASLYVWRVVE